MKSPKSAAVLLACLVLSRALRADTPWLHTEGNTIKDPAGNVVVLRGVDLVDLGATEMWYGGAINMIDRLTNQTDTQGSSPGWYTKVIRIAIFELQQPLRAGQLRGGYVALLHDHDHRRAVHAHELPDQVRGELHRFGGEPLDRRRQGDRPVRDCARGTGASGVNPRPRVFRRSIGTRAP